MDTIESSTTFTVSNTASELIPEDVTAAPAPKIQNVLSTINNSDSNFEYI